MGVKLRRLRNAPYEINFNNGVQIEHYAFQPSKGKLCTEREVSDACYAYLLQNSTCFKDGELQVVDVPVEKLEEDIMEIDEYKANCHTREEVEKILGMQYKKMESEIKKITNKSELGYFVDVAKEIGLDSVSKQKILAEALGTTSELLFEDEE